jgi:uncharacterized BrkB/YihY/UPF0761 family membrane protein
MWISEDSNMAAAPNQYSRYFNFFVLISSILLVGWIALFVLVSLFESTDSGLEIFDRFDLELFTISSAMGYLSVVAAIACIAYIAISGRVRDNHWVWSCALAASVFFNFTGFVLLIFYVVCLRELEQDPDAGSDVR